MAKAIVVKIGGSTLGSNDTTIEDLVTLQRQGKTVVVVHGGGKLITDWLAKQGVTSRFVQGERVTDQPTLEVVTAVLAGLVNKDIVASLNRQGGRAVGISGVDGSLIEGKIADKEKGYVGAVVKVNTAPLEALWKSNFLPIVAPVGLHTSTGSAKTPAILNFNADIVAGEIAAAIGAENLIFLTDVAGVLDGAGKLLVRLSLGDAETLLASGVASGGMIPKIKACLRALSATSTTSIIDGRKPHALLQGVAAECSGTTIQG